MPRFDEQASRDVVIDEDRRHARFIADNELMGMKRKNWALPLRTFTSLFLCSMQPLTVAHYPLIYHNTAYVQRRMYVHATTVAHFLIESEPSTHHRTPVPSVRRSRSSPHLLFDCLRVACL
jgi:hypothetical protein